MKSNIDTPHTACIIFSCLLCLRSQRLQKNYTSITIAFLKYLNYILKYLILSYSAYPHFNHTLSKLGYARPILWDIIACENTFTKIHK